MRIFRANNDVGPLFNCGSWVHTNTRKILKIEDKSNRKRKKNEDQLPKQPKRPHLEENTLTEITVGKEQASDTDESKKMLHLEQNSVENDRGSNNPADEVEEDSDDEKCISMKRPTLLRQLQTILNEYPDDAQILREMVQNAEDAGAKCMKILYDNTNTEPGGTSNIRQYLKTPAICVYNDAMFTEKDWEGVITIYNSVKEKEPLKVGRFGLGFKSVFHMTDTPVIISGNRLLVIDPLKSEIREGGECLDIPLKRLKKNYCPEVTFSNILNRFEFNSDVLEKGQYTGTLFWFPLRQQESSLSSTVYSEEKAKFLFSSFIKEASYNLLFLRNLARIEVYNLKNDLPYFTLEMCGLNRDEFRRERKDFCEKLKELKSELPSASIMSKFEAVVKTYIIEDDNKKLTEDHFSVVSCLTGTDVMSNELKTLSVDKDLHYSPYTGVAYCTKTDRDKRPPGHIFCFLPLPITETSMTGLPIHINGFFDLEPNRRHLKESTATSETGQTDKSLLWNHRMIVELLPKSFNVLIQLIRDRCERTGNTPDLIEDFYNSIPNPDVVEPSWKLLCKTLHETIIQENIFYTKQNGGKWITRSEALFAVFDQVGTSDSLENSSQIQDTVKELLLECNENLVELPYHMMQVLKNTGHTPDTISPKMMCKKLRNSQAWHSYSSNKKLNLLTFILEDNDYRDLDTIELLPLNTKEFTSFSSNHDIDSIYVATDETVKMFPGLEERFISKADIPDDLWDSLYKMAEKDIFQLRCLTDDCLPHLLMQTFKVNCTRKENGHFVPKLLPVLGCKWMCTVWKLISSRYESLASFESVPLIPVRHDIDQNILSEGEVIEYLVLKGNYMLSKHEDYEPLPKVIEKVMVFMGVNVLSPEQTIEFPHVEVIGKYIKLPIVDNVLKCFQDMSSSVRMEKVATNINEKCSDKERSELLKYLVNHRSNLSKELHPLLRMLKIFKQCDNVHDPDMVSLVENRTQLANFTFPKGLFFPRKLLTNNSTEFVKYLGGIEMSEQTCVDETLDLMLRSHSPYSVDDKIKLMIFLQDLSADVLEHVLQKAEDIVFMSSSDGESYRVKDLYDSSSMFLKDLFHGQKGIFPEEKFVAEHRFKQTFLQYLKIRNGNDIDPDHLVIIARNIHEPHHGISEEKRYRKAERFVTFLKNNPRLTSNTVLEQIQDFNWVPVCTSKPEGYPDGLAWYQSNSLASAKEVKCVEFKHLVGTQAPMVSVERVGKHLALYYKWDHPPTQHVVLEHFKNIIDSYQQKENSEYIHMTKSIFKYINELRKKDSLSYDESIENLRSLKCIPTNNKGFKFADMVVTQVDNCHCNFNLEPYIFELANDLYDYKETFHELGVKPCVDFEVLKSVLEHLSQKYQLIEDNSSTEQEDVKKDRILTVNILKAIVDMSIEKTKMTDLLVPINCHGDHYLKFETVEKCTYTLGKGTFSSILDDEDNDEDEEEEKVIYVHTDISNLAPKLGVASVNKRFMSKQNTSALAWGQKEKLTTRIANLLDSYNDGFAVPKELIQNADDAGATKVCFLYDERENIDCREGLFDTGMAECQGQALWVYNDKPFQEKDFKNIIELGGKTKCLETDKIGKFGLGFCSVYNITDVPSFISGNTLVVLDPHLHHLGEAAFDMNPGLLVPLTKSYRKNFPNQFKPYNGIFGCDLSATNKKVYDETLFRFPLRTHKQASESEIKQLPYTKREIIELLMKFREAAANLLLFTQNVTEISVYHLNSKSINPETDKQLLFKTAKSNTNQLFHPIKENRCNVLKEVTNAMEDEVETGKALPIHVVDICIEVSEYAETVDPQYQRTSEVYSWIISWGTGHHSFGMARKLKAEGAIPVGSVAVPITRTDHELTSFIKMNELPTGFYTQSRIFCFLPLPVETTLPLHINGCFMVESDRKSLVRFNKDNKTNDNSSWNDSMLGDVILSAYINLLSSVASRLTDKILESNYWTLWPNLNESQEDLNILVETFYQHVLDEDEPVFYRKALHEVKAVTSSLSNSTFLDPIFRNREDIGDFAFECMLQFHNGGTSVMNMPLHIYHNFMKTKHNSLRKLEVTIVKKKYFFESYFFPNLKNKHWDTNEMSEKRDKLLMEALEDESLHYLVESFECIPVKSAYTGSLCKPSDLVWQSGPISDMFHESDLRFPKLPFCKYEELFKTMHMMVNTITSKLLVERAHSIELQTMEMAMVRSRAVLKYLNTSWRNHLDKKEELHTIKFLPVLKKPEHWSLSWKANEITMIQCFLSPSELFSPWDLYAVGSVGYVMDSMNVSIKEDVLRVILVKNVTIEDALTQLEILGREKPEYSEHIKKIFDSVYWKLSNHLKDCEIEECILERLTELEDKRVICLEGHIVTPDQIAENLIGNCSPYLYKMSRSLQNYKALWRHMEIPIFFNAEKFINILIQRKEEVGETQIPEIDAKNIVNVLENLCFSLKHNSKILSEEEKKGVYIPDNECCLRPISEVCFDDRYPGIVWRNNEVHIIHSQVTQGIINSLGIMSKRHFHLSRFSNGIPFGQKEKLVTRLKNIISAYPRDHSVLNELLQNADDAGATEIHFVLDSRDHGTNRIFDEKWTQLQGPGLCVFNDACFSEDDLIGIQKLGEGSKSDDPTKTGQFGVGFNAVYHLTDVPSFLTRGPSTPNGGTLCVFDPHCSYVPTAESDTPGMQIQDLEILKDSYKDVHDTYLQNELPAAIGTWFRLPLRNEAMAKESSISKECVDVKSVDGMLSKMKKAMKKSLLFLANVRKISISYIDQTNLISRTSMVQLDISDTSEKMRLDFMLVMKEEINLLKLKDKKLKQIEYQEARYEVKIKDEFSKRETWFVVQGFGYPDPSKIPARLNSEYDEGKIGLLPRAGIAILESGMLKEGNAFCFLPLPIETGLPMHVNGHFALDQNRSHLFGMYKEDVRYIWNKCLLEQVAAYSYASCIEYYMNKFDNDDFKLDALTRFFAIFPIFKQADGHWWKQLSFETYKTIYRRELAVFPVCPSFIPHDCDVHSLQERHAHQSDSKGHSLKWVAMKAKGDAFISLFDDLHTLFKVETDEMRRPTQHYHTNYTTRMNESCTFDEEHKLRLTLIDLGMKLVCVPRNVYENINKACQAMTPHDEDVLDNECICTRTVNPKRTLEFLKSWNTDTKDKCLIDFLNIPLSQTIFQTMQRLMCVLHYCLRDNCFKMEDSANAPLLVTNSNILTTLSKDNNIILSRYCNLFPKSSDKFVNIEEVSRLLPFKKCFKVLSIGIFIDLLPRSIGPLIFKVDREIDWTNKFNPVNEKWMIMFWKCLDDFENVAQYFGEWCLFPCTWNYGHEKLIPFKRAYTVVNLRSFEENIGNSTLLKIFTKMNLPSPSRITFYSKHLRDLVATMHTPCKIVNCLHFHREYLECCNLDIPERNTLLAYFNDSVHKFTNEESVKLRGLRLFTTLTNQIVHLEGAFRILVVKCKHMPVFDGLDDLSIQTNTILLQHNAYHEKLYSYMGCTLCYPDGSTYHQHPLLKLYISFILPNFAHLNRQSQLNHLVFVRDNLMSYNDLHDLKPVMKNLRFIPSNENDILLTASNFFSPHNSVCAKLCNPIDFPPNPFCRLEWNTFMVFGGMRSIVTKELFLTFARQIQQNGKGGNSEEQSKELILHLFNCPNIEVETAFLSEVSQINFISGYIVPPKYSSISKQNDMCRLISFQEAVSYEHFKLAWTMSCILPKYAVPTDCTIHSKLSIKNKPSIDCVVSHIHNVCISLNNHPVAKNVVQDLMTYFYEHLDRNVPESENEKVKVRFAQTPIINVTEHNTFVPANQIVVDISKSSEIVPHLLKAPVCYGKYFPLFKILGATDEISIEQYCRVLEIIKKEAKASKVIPEEMNRSEKAIIGVLDCLKNEHILEDLDKSRSILYLLNERKELKPSHELVINDDSKLMRRMECQTVIEFMFDLTMLKKDRKDLNPEELLMKLPQRMRPQKLSSIIKEIPLNTSDITSSEMAVELESFISGDKFRYIATRISKSYQKKMAEQLEDEELQQFLSKLKSLRVMALPKLETSLVYNGEHVIKSTESQSIFFVEETNIVYIQGGIPLTDKWMAMNSHYIAQVIKIIFCNKVISEDLQGSLVYFRESMTDVEHFLDRIGSVSIDFKIGEISWYPDPGSAVEEEFIEFLIADFLTFEAGDIVVYEHFDNAGDSNGQEVSVYIYAKIIRKVLNGTERFPMYLVNIGDGKEIEVRSYRLYKIVRPSHATQTELELYTDGNTENRDTKLSEILQMIEETLVDAWNLGIEEFKRIVRRLIRRWHPDKNENSSFCADVFKHLMEFVKKLQSGFIDVSKINRYRGHSSNDWEECKQRATSLSSRENNECYTFDVDGFADDIIRGYRSRRTRSRGRWSSGYYTNMPYIPDPQPHMARIWIKQAKYDIDAASGALEFVTDKSCNWVCVQSQQAVEKALKAVQVQRDAKKVTNEHHLCSSVATRENSELRDLAQELENIIVNYSRLRYPRLNEFPYAPSELYTTENAVKTIELATKIIDIVDDTYFSN